MDDSVHAAHAAFRQRFQALATQLQANHAAWQEAVRVHDRSRQSTLITREGEMLADVQELITAYQALIAQRHEMMPGCPTACGGEEWQPC